jgi:hypothetical protein
VYFCAIYKMLFAGISLTFTIAQFEISPASPE